MKSIFVALSLAGSLAAGVALAQQSGASGVSGQQGMSGMSGTSGQQGMSGMTGQKGMSGMSGMSGMAGAMKGAAAIKGPMAGTQIWKQAVYDMSETRIGEIDNLVVSAGGQISEAVIGVGGFLGIGEKNVAVAVPAVQMVQDGNSVRLVVQSTKDQLEAAPSYDIRNRRYATDDNGTMNNNTDATGTTTTAPATGTDGTMNNTTGTGTTNSDGSSN